MKFFIDIYIIIYDYVLSKYTVRRL